MSGKNREGGKIEGDLDQWVSIEMCYLNTGPNWIWSKMTLKGICCMRVVKVKLGMRSHLRVTVGTLPGSCQEALGVPLGKMNDQPSTGNNWLPRVQPPWLSRSCVCFCFPSSEPSVFPLIIFSPGTLDHPGVQSRTEVSGTVRLTPGLALRCVEFWKWSQKMGCATFWGLTSLSGGLAGCTSMPPCVPLCKPASPALPLSTLCVLPSSPVTPCSSSYYLAFSNCHHILWLCPFKKDVNKLIIKHAQSLLQLLSFAIIALRQAKRIHQQMAVTIAQ